MTLLSLRHIYKERLRGAGFTLYIPCLNVPHGARLALVGPSGCGKSTALDMLSAVLRPDVGCGTSEDMKDVAGEYMGAEFFFAPEPGKTVDILALWHEGKFDTLAALRRKYVGYVLQTGGLLPFLTARENILLACANTTDIDFLTEKLGIAHLLGARPGQLSVGERQRVAIARALAHKPCLVLADEPTAALDPINAAVVMGLFTTLTQELGSTVILVTHAPQLAQNAGFTLLHTCVQREGDNVLSRLEALP